MSRGCAALAAGALAAGALAGPAAAYVRTSDAETGAEVSWPLPIVPYVVSSEPSFASPTCAAGPSGDPFLDAIRASFAAWEQGSADLQLVYGGRIAEIRTGLPGSAENLVVMRRGWCSNDPRARVDPCMSDPAADCGNLYDCFDDGPSGQNRDTVALTTILYDPSTGRIFDADLEVNGWDGVPAGSILPGTTGPSHGYYFTCGDAAGLPLCATYGQDGCSAYDLQNTVTHEAGHVIGLAHPCEDHPVPGTPLCSSPPPPGEIPYAERTMYPSTVIGETSKRVLSPDEVAGVRAAYPRPSGGCGAGGTPGALALLLAVLGLRPSVRRRARPRSRRPGACRR